MILQFKLEIDFRKAFHKWKGRRPLTGPAARRGPQGRTAQRIVRHQAGPSGTGRGPTRLTPQAKTRGLRGAAGQRAGTEEGGADDCGTARAWGLARGSRATTDE